MTILTKWNFVFTISQPDVNTFQFLYLPRVNIMILWGLRNKNLKILMMSIEIFLAHPLYLKHLVFFEIMYWKYSLKELRNIWYRTHPSAYEKMDEICSYLGFLYRHNEEKNSFRDSIQWFHCTISNKMKNVNPILHLYCHNLGQPNST